jgi:hypothetical protein
MEVLARSRETRMRSDIDWRSARVLRQIASHPSVGGSAARSIAISQRITHVRFAPKLPLLKIRFYASIPDTPGEHGVPAPHGKLRWGAAAH